ncbi:hypothetical protein [Phreatobacter oligotrophus]|uniref:hypothetical protein n=1 Tax=Phreatobacter oligotrophus TaxID=1122261 RepID=UPI002356E2EA|nr:hypothetical protein [Phreatobacter oligotrophus]MBX9991965.1 hypothetical protein [Phreatobacter oligotrophus]
MTLPSDLPADLARAAAGAFPGEPIRWAGRPSSRAAFWRALPIWLFAIPWTAFALFWEAMAIGGALGLAGRGSEASSTFGLVFTLFGLPFIAVGIVLMGLPFWTARRTARTLWLVTTRRVGSVTLTASGVTIRTVWPHDLLAMECRERRDGSGTLKLIFGEGRDSDGDKVERSETLGHIPEVRRVEALVRQLADDAKAAAAAT